MAASPLYSLRTQRALELRQRRRADDLQEHPARHRRAAPVHGLPVQGRRPAARRVLARPLRRADGRRADGRRVRARECATTSRTRRSTRPRAPRIPTRRCGRSTVRRASRRPRAALSLAGRHRPRERRAGRAAPDHGASSASPRSRGSRSTIPAATPSPAAGSTTPASSIPTSRSRTSRTARSWSRCRRSRCRRTCSRTRTCTASRADGASTRRARTRPRCSPAPPACRAGRLPAVLGITGDDAEADRQAAAAPPGVPCRVPTSRRRSRCSTT